MKRNLMKYGGIIFSQRVLLELIKKGMSREAAIMAYGYPPTHANPDIESNTWNLWKNRWDKMIVNFSNGKVSNIID